MAVPRSTPAWNFFVFDHTLKLFRGYGRIQSSWGYPLLPHNIALRKNLCNFAVGYIE